MRANELVHVLAGLLLLASSLECGRSDHVHLKIHVPNVMHKHNHVKTKLVHVYHPKVIHSDHSSVQFLHSRRDPNVGGIVNGGYAQPLVNMNKPELRITEAEFNKWRYDQAKKAYEERKRLYDQEVNQHEPVEDEEEDEEEEEDNETKHDVAEPDEDDLYKKHKANKANSSTSRKKHKNHNYNQDFEASNSDKTYANYPSRNKSRKKPMKSSHAAHQAVERPRKTWSKPNGYSKPHADSTNIQPIYVSDPTAIDPSYYSTIPKDQDIAASDNQDDIYSGLISTRITQQTADKSKLLADINYNRKQQTRNVVGQRRRRTQ